MPDVVRKRLEAENFEVDVAAGVMKPRDLADRLTGAWGYILGGLEYADRTLLDGCRDLRVICILGAGHSEYLDAGAVRPGVSLSYTPHANARAVAELMFGLTISLRRQIVWMAQLSKKGLAPAQGAFSPTLVGATIGVLGMGHVGEAFARMYQGAFDASVLFWNRSPKPELVEKGWNQCGIEEVLARADLVAVACAYHHTDTHHLLNAERLGLMQAHALLVCTSRARIIDPEAIFGVLQNRSIGGVALDGYYVEPLPAPDDDPFELLKFRDDLLIVTPHIGFASIDAINTMFEMAADNIIAIGRNQPAPHPIPR